MVLSLLYKALEVTLQNDKKIEICILGANDTNIKVLINFLFFISLFPQVFCKWPLHWFLGLWKWTLKMAHNLKFIALMSLLQMSRLWLKQIGTMSVLIFSNGVFKLNWMVNMVFNLRESNLTLHHGLQCLGVVFYQVFSQR